MRIHERYSAGSDRKQPPRKPWPELDDFYRRANLRQVQNALRIVEQNAGHTWNTLGVPLDPPLLPKVPENASGEQLVDLFGKLGFTEEAVWEMLQAEFEDWSDFYKKHGWGYGTKRDYENKKHEKLVSWEQTILCRCGSRITGSNRSPPNGIGCRGIGRRPAETPSGPVRAVGKFALPTMRAGRWPTTCFDRPIRASMGGTGYAQQLCGRGKPVRVKLLRPLTQGRTPPRTGTGWCRARAGNNG